MEASKNSSIFLTLLSSGLLPGSLHILRVRRFQIGRKHFRRPTIKLILKRNDNNLIPIYGIVGMRARK